jgi:type II secretory pathway predicted ATPase ExeA
MYEKFYGFRERPFSLTPDPDFMFLSRYHRAGLTMLEYGMMNHTPTSLITGEVGCGKTTLIRYLLNRLDSDVRVGLISNTNRSFGHLMQWVSMAFELPYKGEDDASLYDHFTRFLIHEYAAGRHVVLIVDEAQNLSSDLLEELRVLSNINADKHTVLQIILVGQPELRDTVRRPELKQLAQRIGVDQHIYPLDARETKQYIWHRLRVAGGRVTTFRSAAIDLITAASGGVPRLINQLCDASLVYGYAERKHTIDWKLAQGAIEMRVKGGVFPEARVAAGGAAPDRAGA